MNNHYDAGGISTIEVIQAKLTSSTSFGRITMTSHDFFLAYVGCALWSTDNGDDEFLDDHYDLPDIHNATLRKMQDDCQAFIRKAKEFYPDLLDAAEAAGHDFWLTRSGHGAGFWGGDWDDTGCAQELTELANSFGVFEVYVGDDNLIHGSPL